MKHLPLTLTTALSAALVLLTSSASNGAVITAMIPFGDIWVTPYSSPGDPEHRLSFDLDENGTEDFFLIGDLAIRARIGNAGANRFTGIPIMEGDTLVGGIASYVSPLSIVGAGTLEEGVNWWSAPEGHAGALPIGPSFFAPPDIRYVGLEFSAADGLHYGYIQLRFVNSTTFPLGWAWETEPGKPITVPVPEPSGAALAVMGCVLAVASRRRKTQHLPHCE